MDESDSQSEVKSVNKKQKLQKTILFTGAHSTPAFAVIDQLLDDGLTTIDDSKATADYKLLWVSEKHNQRGNTETSAEYKTVTEHYKIPFIEITAGKLHRKWTSENFVINLKDLFRLLTGFVQAFFIILKHKPDLIMSFGGFLAVPIVFWARIFKKKIITHEQTVVSGLANEVISRYANKVLVSWQNSIEYFPKEKVVFTGNPLRKDIFEVKSNITEKFDPELPTIYITGGNQGAHEINKRVFIILDELLARANVIHQTGNSTVTSDYSKAIEIKDALREDKKERYIVRDYIFKDEIGEVFEKSDIIISRAGVNTITELATLGKLSILIPIPWTHKDEQTMNAKMLENVGLSRRLIQSESLNPRLLLDSIIDGIDKFNNDIGFNGEALEEVKENALKLVKKDAQRNIVKVMKSLLK